MAEEKEGNIIEELDGLPEEIEELEKNPILKPLLDYNKAAVMLTKEDESESEYLKNKIDELQELLDTGIYDDSSIAIKYKGVTEVYQRLLLIMARYTEVADKKIVELKKVVEKYYISKREHERIISELKEDFTKKEEPVKTKKPRKEKEPPTQEEIEKDNEEVAELLGE